MPNCLCGSPAIAGEVHFPTKAQTVEELTLVLLGVTLVETFYLCESCFDFTYAICEGIGELETAQ